MSHTSPSPQSFGIHCDSHTGENNQSSQDHEECNSALSQSQPLCHLSISQSQNLQLEQLPIGYKTHELNQALSEPQWVAIAKDSNKKEKRAGSRLTRPSLASNTFEILSTVSESESEIQSVPAASKVSGDDQLLQLPVGQNSSHPLSIAARSIPPLEEQFVKHRDGLFEWILAVRVRTDFKLQRGLSSGTDDQDEARKVYFGCNLLPKTCSGENEAPKTTCPVGSHLLLVTPLKETKEVLEVFRDPIGDSIMTLPDANSGHGTPARASNSNSEHEAEQLTPASTVCARGEDSFMEPITSTGHDTPAKTSNHSSVHGAEQVNSESTVCTRGEDSVIKSITSRPPTDPVARIEDSFEALDRLEEQLEAFDKVAHFDQYIPAVNLPSTEQDVVKVEIATTRSSVRFATPQPKRTFAKPGSASLRVKPATEPRKPLLRKVTSMILDSPKLKAEEKTLMQVSAKPPTIRRAIDVSTQRLISKSPKQPIVPKFEPPGQVVAQHAKEKKVARLATQRATQPTAASLRRSKSLKLPMRPTFELPGEAISRRKREEHQAQLRAHEEEERKRREFKARPIPTNVVSTTVPRGTMASKARQSTTTLTENAAQIPTSNKRPATTIGSHSRPALFSTINRPQSRGRGPKGESSPVHVSRATSRSTGSVSRARSAISIEDAQMQKLRGFEIYQRDNSWTDSRVREKCERETLARLAREEAAEKSRQQSREWAAKQAKKRMTINSLRDVMA